VKEILTRWVHVGNREGTDFFARLVVDEAGDARVEGGERGPIKATVGDPDEEGETRVKS